jgi:hypothetical protein
VVNNFLRLGTGQHSGTLEGYYGSGIVFFFIADDTVLHHSPLIQKGMPVDGRLVESPLQNFVTPRYSHERVQVRL